MSEDIDDVEIAAKRRVEICVGVPEMLAGMEVAKHAEMPHYDECYFINFVDAPDDDGIGQNGFTCQLLCLCGLKMATAAWLNGATEEETKVALVRHDDGNHT